jgi:hypothetical protein
VRRMIRLGVVVGLMLAGSVATAQEAAVPGLTEPRMSQALIPLKVVLTVARYSGEKKLSGAPYAMWVTANEPNTTKLRMGVELPVRTAGAVTYRSVGTNIDCNAVAVANGAYKLALTVTDSSVALAERTPTSDPLPPGAAAQQPSFRSFTSTFIVLLRDGQSAQYATATDPVSGEVTKIDVALSVLK